MEVQAKMASVDETYILLWGCRVWNEVLQQLEILDRNLKLVHTFVGGQEIALVNVPHPSGRYFTRSAVQKQLENVGVALIGE